MAAATSPPPDVAVDPAPRPERPERPAPAAVTDVAGLGRPRAVAFIAPALALIAAFLVFPAVWTLYLGITDYRLTGRSARAPRTVGLQNYRDAVVDPRFHHALLLTLLYVLGSAIVGQTVLGFTLAWTLRTARRWVRGVLEALVLLAWVLPSSVIAFLWLAFLDREDGTLNRLLGTPGTAWLVKHPMASIVVFNTWHGTAFSLLLFGSALGSVPPSQLETARLAGASVLGQLRDVVLPHIRGHLLTNTLLISLWTFNDFTPYLLTAGGPEQRSEILPVYIYNTSLYSGKLGYGSAVSLLMLLINLVIALFYIRLLRSRR